MFERVKYMQIKQGCKNFLLQKKAFSTKYFQLTVGQFGYRRIKWINSLFTFIKRIAKTAEKFVWCFDYKTIHSHWRPLLISLDFATLAKKEHLWMLLTEQKTTTYQRAVENTETVCSFKSFPNACLYLSYPTSQFIQQLPVGGFMVIPCIINNSSIIQQTRC